MKIEIDQYAGFCFGVTKAIKSAENQTADAETIFCLGKIVHNIKEEERLNKLGLKTISYENIPDIAGQKIIIRAHGEPPETYNMLNSNNVKIIDETCPVVLKLQRKIRDIFEKNTNAGIVIFGKKGHAEVNGLVGQTDGNAIVISNLKEAEKINFSKPVFLFSQTTSNYNEYKKIEEYLGNKVIKENGNAEYFTVYQTICPSVVKRIPRIKEFCTKHDLIIFASDHNSSNGKMLFESCKEVNHNSYFVVGPEELKKEWFSNNVSSVGISGATSTPLWLIEDVIEGIKKITETTS